MCTHHTPIQVVVTNQLTTKVEDALHPYQAAPAYAWGGGGPGGGPPLAPTLGACLSCMHLFLSVHHSIDGLP